jgi:predicted transcriptional regulator
MIPDATLTVRLPRETEKQLSKLAGYARRDPSSLGADAIADYVQRELAIIDAIERGRADVAAGRTSSHEDVARAARDVIEAARRPA